MYNISNLQSFENICSVNIERKFVNEIFVVIHEK